MVIIRLKNGAEWARANWIFRQLKEDIVLECSDSPEIRTELDKAEAFGGLYLDSIGELLADKITGVLTAVVEATVEGKIEGLKRNCPNDQEGQRMYIESVQELKAILLSVRYDSGR